MEKVSLESLAKLGDVDAQYRLASNLFDSPDYGDNIVAIYWLKKAAEDVTDQGK